jgi:hypothetical protein
MNSMGYGAWKGGQEGARIPGDVARHAAVPHHHDDRFGDQRKAAAQARLRGEKSGAFCIGDSTPSRAARISPSPVRRKDSVRRFGLKGLRNARSDSVDDDGLRAVVGARQVAGDRHASPGESSRRLWLPSAMWTSSRPDAQAAMAYSWWSPASPGRLPTVFAGTGRTGGSHRLPTGACILRPRCGHPW